MKSFFDHRLALFVVLIVFFSLGLSSAVVDSEGNDPSGVPTRSLSSIASTFDIDAQSCPVVLSCDDWAYPDGFNTELDYTLAPPLFRKEYYTGSGRPRGLCTADMDQDGNIDVVVADREYSNPLIEGSEIKIWMNNGTGMLLSPSPPSLYSGDDIVPVVPFHNEIIPRLEIKNFGQHTESFNTIFQVLEGASIIHEEILLETLYSGETKIIDFSSWEVLGDMGAQYDIVLFTDLAGDEFPDNDVVSGTYYVDSVSIHSHSMPMQNAFSAGASGTYWAKAMRLTPLAYPAQITEIRCFLNIVDSDIPVTFCVWSDADPGNRDTFELEEIIWSTTEDVGPYYGWYVVDIPDSVVIQVEDVECYIGAGWPAITSVGADIFPLWKVDVIYALNRYGNAGGSDIFNLTWGDSGYRPHICGAVKYDCNQGIVIEDRLQGRNIELSIYPNPFSSSTKIEYDVPWQSQVQVEIYDILGRRVDVLVNELQGTGIYSIDWDGNKCVSGMYFVRISAESNENIEACSEIRRVILLR